MGKKKGKQALEENKDFENTSQNDANLQMVQEEIKRQEMQIAQNITITQEEMKLRRYMDIRRW